MKKFSIITTILGSFLAIASFVLPFFVAIALHSNSPAVGIIGGVDSTPTLFEYWLSSVYYPLSLLGVAVAITGVVSLIFKKVISKHCSVTTSAIALIISVLFAISSYCLLIFAFTTLIASAISWFALLIACVILTVFYVTKYIKDKKYKRIIFDFIIVIIYSIPSFMLFGYVIDAIMTVVS